MIIYLTIKCISAPLQRVADLTGYNGDHSIMIYVKKKIDGYIEWDKKLRQEVKQLMNHIEASLFDQNKEKLENIDFVSLNNITALRERPDRAILLVGYSEEEINQIKELLSIETQPVDYSNTGIYLFNDNNNEKK